MELLRGVNKDTIWGTAIYQCLKSDGNIGELVLELQSQYMDSPSVAISILGEELAKYIMRPLDKPKSYSFPIFTSTDKRERRGRKPKNKPQ
jgi:hypothetical protein